jgi:hypothetical protein
MKTMLAALTCGVALAAAPAAMAQAPPDFDPLEAGETIVGALQGGVQQDHAYVCDEDNPTVKSIVEGVQEALDPQTGKFRNFAAMSTFGYMPYADAPLLGLSGGQGHWINPGYIEDGHLMDPDRPESILVDRWNRPIGVMFINDQPTDPADPSTAGPDMYVGEDGTPCNGWHYHTEILADAYWYAYKYLYSDDVVNGDLQPPDRTPDLMHVWAYGADGDEWDEQFQHGLPPKEAMAEDMAAQGMSQDPGPDELAAFHTATPNEIGPGPRLPGMGPQPKR